MRLSDVLEYIFIKNKVWLYLSVVLLASYMMMQLSQHLNLLTYLKWNLFFTLPSLPIFIWVSVREKLMKNASVIVRLLSWLFVFAIYPFLFTKIMPVAFNGMSTLSTYPLALFGFVLLEIALWVTNKKDSNISFTWIKKMTPLLWFAILVLIMALLFPLMNTFFENNISGRSLFFMSFYFTICVLQLFIIYMSYYMYYYVQYNILFNKLLKTKGIVYYAMGLAAVVMVVVPFHNYIISFFPVVNQLKLHSTGLNPVIFDDFNYGLPIFVLFISLPFVLLQEWYKKSSDIKELERQKSEVELSLLKEQINPHFFFNTLNNLYAMSLTKDDQTPEVILKLSELMRYVIYKGKEKLVLLSDEVDYVKDYIDLQMIRLHKKVDYIFNENIENRDWKISPLLLIIFIENAFKHGIEKAETEATLKISIDQLNDKLLFKCQNSFDIGEANNSPGIGLKNLRKRLDILYPDTYKLETEIIGNFYTTSLTIIK